MKKPVYVAMGLLASAVLGYLLFLTILHIGSLFMHSDDTMHKAVVTGLVFWLLVIVVGATTVYCVINHKSIGPHVNEFLAYFLATAVVIIVFDNLFGFASAISGMDAISQENRQIIAITMSVVSCVLGVYITRRWLIKHL